MFVPHHGKSNGIRHRGFTLIEALTVVAVIAVLTLVLVPVLGRMLQDSHRAGSVNQLRQIGVALFQFAADNNNTFPAPAGVGSGSWWGISLAQGDYLGKSKRWVHDQLIAPGIRYESSFPTYFTYTATGAMAGFNASGQLNHSIGRRLSASTQPAKSPLVFLAKQSSTKAGRAHTVLARVNFAPIQKDLVAASAEDTEIFNFDLGGRMPVLMGDGRVDVWKFDDLNELVNAKTWEDCP
jgi:prepilin-type N-terminal cleavage/methylation domain-containing protein